jgi:hypothetical protein
VTTTAGDRRGQLFLPGVTAFSLPEGRPVSVLWRMLTLPPATAARVARIIITEQHLGGPVLGMIVAVVSFVVALLSGLSVTEFFYSGTAADVTTLLAVTAVARAVWFMGWASH